MDNFEDVIKQLEDKIKNNDQFAYDVYGALCNMRWKEIRNPENVYSCSWRYAGGLIAGIRENNDHMNYMEFYSSGNEGQVTKKIERIFKEFGWEPYPWKQSQNE